MTGGWAATNTLREVFCDALATEMPTATEARQVIEEHAAALALVETALDAAARVTALLSHDGPPFLLDGRRVTDEAEVELLSLHDHLNDLRAVREGAS